MNGSDFRPPKSIKQRQRAFIAPLDGGIEIQHRLFCMDLHIGREANMLLLCTRADDPAIVAAGDTRLAIGYGMASRIMGAADPV